MDDVIPKKRRSSNPLARLVPTLAPPLVLKTPEGADTFGGGDRWRNRASEMKSIFEMSVENGSDNGMVVG